jgi:hypothetical protein
VCLVSCWICEKCGVDGIPPLRWPLTRQLGGRRSGPVGSHKFLCTFRTAVPLPDQAGSAKGPKQDEYISSKLTICAPTILKPSIQNQSGATTTPDSMLQPML